MAMMLETMRPMTGAILLAAALAGAPARAGEAEDLAADFMALAFSAEFGAAGAQPLAKWASPVLYEASPEAAPILAHLARLTGLELRSGAPAALRVRFSAGDGSSPLLRRFALDPGFFCLTLVETASGGAIKRAEILIKPDLSPQRLRACLIEETAQAMGLLNDAATRGPSVFNDDDRYAELTRHDENLLRLLYDPRLTPGETAERAAPVVAIIARGLAGRTEE